MRITTILLIAAAVVCVRSETARKDEEETGILDCVFEDNSLGCLRTRLARDIDEIELGVTGKSTETPMSAVIEQAADLVAEVVDDFQNPGKADETEEVEEGRGEEEARRKKFGKKKKKHLQKLLGLAMLFKAKLSLLLQLISTHFQLKFFVIAIISLILNAAKFWLDLKKSHPSKVIYYEHAQHQHHYDHEDVEHDHHWGRSSNDSPQNLAYSAYASQK